MKLLCLLLLVAVLMAVQAAPATDKVLLFFFSSSSSLFFLFFCLSPLGFVLLFLGVSRWFHYNGLALGTHHGRRSYPPPRLLA